MTTEDLTSFSYLWAGSEPGWVLWQLGDDDQDIVVFNRETRMALVIEDEEVDQAVIRRMTAEGADVITEYPIY